MPNGKKYCIYESPNIVIVPTVSFLNGPPEKKIKLDDDSKTATTTSNIKTFKNNTSWASNYLQSIGQSPAQLATSSKSKIPIVCYPDRGAHFEVIQENPVIKNDWTEIRKPVLKTVSITDINNFPERILPMESKSTNEKNITVIQRNPPKPTTQLDSNVGSNKIHSLLKKCDSEIQDKQSLVAKNQIKEAGFNKLTSKLPLTEPKTPTVPPSKPYNEKDGKNQMQKQKKIHNTPCFKSKLNENCYKVNKGTKIKKCDSEIQDKRSLVAKNQIKEAGHDNLTSKLPLSEPKKPIVLPSKTYNEKDGKTQMQKQKIIHNTPCFKSTLNENCYKVNKVTKIKKCDYEIQDKRSLVAKNQIKEAGHDNLTSKLPLSEPKKPIVLPSKTYNEKDGKTQMQKQKIIHNTPCFKSTLNNKNENCYKVNKVTKINKCDSEIQDKQSLVAKNQIKEAGHNNLTSKLPLSKPKKPIVLRSKTYNEKDGNNQMQKQKKIHNTPCFKSKLKTKNENCYKVNKVTEKHITKHNSNQKLVNEVHYNKIKLKACREFSTPDAQEETKKLSGKEKYSRIKNQDINEIDNRVKSLLSSIFPVEKNEETAGTQLCLHTSKSKKKKTNIKVETTEYIPDSFTSAENTNRVDNIEKNVVSPYESGKGKNSGNQTHLDMNTFKKNNLTKAYTVTQSSKYKCEKQKNKSKFNTNSKVAKNVPFLKVHNKHNQLKHISKEVGHIKEKFYENRKCSPLATEVTNPTIADHTNTGKTIMKNSVKSVVQLTDNFEFEGIKSPLVVEDLRRKLNRAKKYRDNLIVSVPNDVTFDRDNEVKQELSTQNKSSKTKVTTIKLVINLISGQTKEKSIEEEPKSNESCELASLDLSFLDDFNVDDIVDSLNYDVNICKHIEVDTKNGGTCEACGPNSSNNNGHVMDIIPGSMSENNEPDKTRHKHEIGIETEHIQLGEESMNEMVIPSNKQLTCNTSRKKDVNAYIESRISGKNLTMIDKRNLLKPSGNHRTIETNLKKCFSKNSTGKNHTFISTEENIKETSSQSNFEAERVQQSGVNMQPQNANTTDKSSVDSLLNICMDTFKQSDDKSKGTTDLTEPDQKTVPNMQQLNTNITYENFTDAMYIDLTEPEQNTNLKRQRLNANITNKSSTDDLFIDLNDPEEKSDPKSQHLNSKIKNKSSADILSKLLLNTMIDSSKTSDDRSNGAIDLTNPEQKTVPNILEVNNNITSSTDYNIFIDLTEPERNTNPKVQQLNTNIKDNISADTSLDSVKLKTDTSKSSHNITYIDLTKPEQIFCPNMQQQNTNIKGVIFADTLIKSSTSTKHTSKSSDNIKYINSSEPEQNVVRIMQQLALNTRLSVENCFSNDSSQTSASNVELLKTTSIKVATENEIDPKIQNKCNEKVENECNFKMTKPNEASKENTCPTKSRSEPICQNSPKAVLQENTTQVTSLQVDSDKTNKNDIHIDQPKATDTTYVKGQDSSDIVKHSPQASKQLLEKVESVKTTAGLRKSPCEEILSRDLESRMIDYLGINYHIGSLICKGKYSKIFHCVGPNKNEYAIKVLHKQQDRYELGIKKENMLIDMQKDIPKENHHFVFLINGFGIEGRWCFLMEYYPKNLRQVLNEKNECFHNIDDVQKLSRQLVSAVIMLRHNNIVHSDIKPEHILLNSSLDRLKLCGFDECRSVDQVILLPNIGTSSYRAPELILGYSDGFSIDVWSTALVMFEMVTGRKLFPGVYNNDILFKQMSVFGNIPLQMIHSSIFKTSHFCGHYTYTHFMRRTGYMGKKIELIGNFHRFGITSDIFNAYQKVFQNTATRDKVKDKQKLKLFCDLLHQMFVMDPKQRLPIEFVYANPFIYEKFDGTD